MEYFDYRRNMESKTATSALSALAHEGRLGAFCLLVRAGPAGLAAGEIARRLKVPPNSLSSNLGILSQAGLISSRREGRSIIYSAHYGAMAALLGFLVEDCCEGAAEVCAPLYAALARTGRCAPAASA